MQSRLFLTGCRLASLSLGAARQSLRGGRLVPAAEYGSRSEGGRRGGGGGRRERGGDKEAAPSIWGDDWDVGAGKSSDKSQSSGWLSMGGAQEERKSSPGLGGEERQQRGGGGGGEWRDRRDDRGGRGGAGGGDWRDRRGDAGGRGGRGGGGEWRDRRNDRGSSGGGGGEWRDKRNDRESGGGGGEWRERRGDRDSSERGGSGGGEWRDRSASAVSGGDKRESRGGGSWGDKREGRGGGGGSWADKGRGGGGSWGDKGRGGGGSWADKREGRGGGGSSSWGDKREGRGGGGSSSWGDKREGRGGWQSEGRRERGGWEDRGSTGGGAGAGGEPWEGADGAPDAAGGGATSRLREFWLGDTLYGVSPVLAALQAGRRQVHALYLQDGMDLAKRKDKGAITAVKKRAEELGARVEYASKHDLNMLSDNRPHQGVMLDCSPLDFEPLAALPDAPTAAAAAAAGGRLPVWLCLDEVMDPQNFGAALRCAHFLGVAGVLTCHRNSAPLSAVVSKASAGAMELLPVHSTKSLPQVLADARGRGWQVLGAASEGGAVSAAGFTLRQPAVLVMGNEGYGLRTTVRRLCDAMLQIDSGAAAGMVDSLNVSVATGILLHRLLTAQEPGNSGGGAGGGGAAAAAEGGDGAAAEASAAVTEPAV